MRLRAGEPQQVHARLADDPRFAPIGVSLDERPGDAEGIVRSRKLGWLQGIVEPDAPVVAAYGAPAIPAMLLVGPDGKIIAWGMRGEDISKVVARALAKP